MIPFSAEDWLGSLIFVGIWLLIIGIPCFFMGFIGKRIIDRIGYFPSQAPVIQMKYLAPLIFIEVFTFLLLLGFYKLFQGI